MKTLIAIPCMDFLSAKFCQSLSMMQKVGEVCISFKIGSLIYRSRDHLAKTAVEAGADYVLWLDSDMVFKPDLMERMFEKAEENTILTGLYYRRVPPFAPVLFDKLTITEDGCKWMDTKTIPDKPFEVEGCGFGAVLMPTHILVDVFTNNQAIFEPIHGVGEDLAFCWRARQLGYKIICDPSIELGHVAHTVINGDFYKVYSQQNK